MSIVRYQHWPRHAARQDEIKQVFDASAIRRRRVRPWSQPVGPARGYQGGAERFVIFADLPGVDPEEIEVNMDKGLLSHQRRAQRRGCGEGERYSRGERAQGVFYRRFALPDSANADGISATGRNGVLEIASRSGRKPRRAASRWVEPAAT